MVNGRLHLGQERPSENLFACGARYPSGKISGNRRNCAKKCGTSWEMTSLSGRHAFPLIFATVNLERLPQRVQPAGNVQDDLPALICGATDSAYSFVYEGFGLLPADGMACRTPVVTSDTTGQVLGDARISIDPTDGGDFAERLLQLCRSRELREKLRVKGLGRAAPLTCARSGPHAMANLGSVAGG